MSQNEATEAALGAGSKTVLHSQHCAVAVAVRIVQSNVFVFGAQMISQS